MKSRIKEQGNIVHIVIISILVVGLLGALGFIFWQNFINTDTKSNTDNVTSTETDKTDWKTYTSMRDGYSVDYPKDWIAIAETESDGPYIRNFDLTKRQPEGGYPEGYINVRVLKSTDEDFAYMNKTAQEWFSELGEKTVSHGPVTYEPKDVKTFDLNGIDAKQLKSVFTEIDEDIVFIHQGDLYSISIYPYGGSSNETVASMLKSFKLP